MPPVPVPAAPLAEAARTGIAKTETRGMLVPPPVVAKPAPVGSSAKSPETGAAEKSKPARFAVAAVKAEPPVTAVRAAPPPQVVRRAEPPRKPAPPTAGKSAYAVQLASVKSQGAADREWARLKQRYATLLKDFEPSVEKAVVEKRGTFYRLRVMGLATRKQANALCTKLKVAGQGCLVVRL